MPKIQILSKDFGKDIFPKMLAEQYRVFAYPYSEYWVDVGTIQSYWEAHMDLLQDAPPLDLIDREWIIHTRSEERPPVNIRTGATVNHSLITDGCTIEGTVEYSILSPGVRVARGAVVKQSIIMPDTVIEAGAVIDKCIIDKNVSGRPLRAYRLWRRLHAGQRNRAEHRHHGDRQRHGHPTGYQDRPQRGGGL